MENVNTIGKNFCNATTSMLKVACTPGKDLVEDAITFVQNNSPIGRMLSFGEGPLEAAKNSLIYQKEAIVSAIANNSGLGRMYVHGEDFKTAMKNAAELKPVEHSVPAIPYENRTEYNDFRKDSVNFVNSLF